MTIPTKPLDAARERVLTTSLAADRARKACNGQHDPKELDRLLRAALRANEVMWAAITLHGEAHAAVHQKEGA